MLNTRSGLLGVSGDSGDVRALLEAESAGDREAALALEMFCYRCSKYVGAYFAALQGTNALVFGGGIGENSAEIRTRVCERLKWCGVHLDEERNARSSGLSARITSDESSVDAYVIPVDEAAVMVDDTLTCLRDRMPSASP